MDIESYSKWDDYTEARDDMFAASHTAWAPWHVAQSDDKRRARLNIISHLLSQIPYKASKQEEITLPKRGKPRESRARELLAVRVPEVF
jgi:polyphosphate kinase